MKAEQSFLLDALVYLTDCNWIVGNSLSDNIEYNRRLNSDKYVFMKKCGLRAYHLEVEDVLEAVLRDRELAQMVVLSYSDVCSGLCLLNSENKEVTFVFGGFLESEWIDNASVVLEQMSVHQVEAYKWMRCMIEEYDFAKGEYKIYACGHFKGGNKAVFCTAMTEVVNECYAYDSPGLSEEFVRVHGEDYSKKASSITYYENAFSLYGMLGCKNAASKREYYDSDFMKRGLHEIFVLDKNYSVKLRKKLDGYNKQIKGFADVWGKIMALEPDKKESAVKELIYNMYENYR